MTDHNEINAKIKRLIKLRVTLIKNGWKPLPLIGKAPRLSDWINVTKNITPQQITQITKKHPEWGNTGILCDGIIAVDIDVPDEPTVAEIVSLADELLGGSTLYRIGNAPKALIVYRADQMTKIMTPEVIMPSGGKARVEILATGQQFAAFGVHPETGGHWVWKMESPEIITPQEAPFVTHDQCTAFLNAAEEVLLRHGGQSREPLPMQFTGGTESYLSPKHTHDIAPSAEIPIEKHAVFNEVIEGLNRYKNADIPYDSWIRIGYAIFDALGHDGRELWDAWSATSSKSNPKTTAKTWRGITKNQRPQGAIKITGKTLFYEALKAEGKYVGDQIKDELESIRGLPITKASTPSDKGKWESLRSTLLNPPVVPDDLVINIISPGTINLIAGAPKTGKTWFAMDFAIHCAGGKGFLDDMIYPSRPLKVVYLQAELSYPHFAKRLAKLTLPDEYYEEACENFVYPRQFREPLSQENITLAIEKALKQLNGSAPDLIFIDPLRNFFEDPTGKGENDSMSMIKFMRDRIEPFIHVFPQCAVIIIHHTRKNSKKDFADNPFDSIAGSSALRGYYATGILLHVPNESIPELKIFIEARHSEKHYPPRTLIRSETGRLIVSATSSVKLEGEARSKRHVAELQRQNDVVISLIRKEAAAGRIYTKTQFSKTFQTTKGLGSYSSLERRLANMAACGLIKFRKNDLGELGVAVQPRSKHQYLVAEDTVLILPSGETRLVVPDYECDKGTGDIVPIKGSPVWGDTVEPAESPYWVFD